MTDSKKRYQSKTIMAQIVSAIMLGLAIFKVDMDVGMVTEAVTAIGGLIATGMVIYGRIKASTKIK